MAALTLTLPHALVLGLILGAGVFLGLILYRRPGLRRGRSKCVRGLDARHYQHSPRRRNFDWRAYRRGYAYAYELPYNPNPYGVQLYEHDFNHSYGLFPRRDIRTIGLGDRDRGLEPREWFAEPERGVREYEWVPGLECFVRRERGGERGRGRDEVGFGADGADERREMRRGGWKDAERAFYLGAGDEDFERRGNAQARGSQDGIQVQRYGTAATSRRLGSTTLRDFQPAQESIRAGGGDYSSLRPELRFTHYDYADDDEDEDELDPGRWTEPQPRFQHQFRPNPHPHSQPQPSASARPYSYSRNAQSALNNTPSDSLSGETLVDIGSATRTRATGSSRGYDGYRPRQEAHFAHYDYNDASDPDPMLPHPHWTQPDMASGASAMPALAPTSTPATIEETEIEFSERDVGSEEGASATCSLCSFCRCAGIRPSSNPAFRTVLDV